MTALSRSLASSERVSWAPRAGLALVAAAQLEIAVWGLVAPRSFFGKFPAPGHHWVAALGPYNEHLVRDFAASELGFAVLLGFAAWTFARPLVLAAGIAFIVATLPHFGYHLTTTGSFSTADNVGSLAGFVLELVVVAFAMAAAGRSSSSQERTPS
jgi:hypothetical protein